VYNCYSYVSNTNTAPMQNEIKIFLSDWHIFIGLFCPFQTISLNCIHFVYNVSCTSRHTTEYKDTSDSRQYIDTKYVGTYQITSRLRSCSPVEIFNKVVFRPNLSSGAWKHIQNTWYPVGTYCFTCVNLKDAVCIHSCKKNAKHIVRWKHCLFEYIVSDTIQFIFN